MEPSNFHLGLGGALVVGLAWVRVSCLSSTSRIAASCERFSLMPGGPGMVRGKPGSGRG